MPTAAIAFDPVEVAPDLTHWCWAVVAAKIVRHYRRTNVRACDIAQSVFGRSDCCRNPLAYDQPRDLEDALLAYQHLGPRQVGIPRVEDIRKELASGRPVACGVSWDGASTPVGHFVLVTMADDYSKEVSVWDPEDGKTYTAPLRVHALSYRDKGRWERAYFTKP